MSEVSNPYIAGNPVTGSEMFFGRQDVFGFIRDSLVGKHRDNVIVLYGQRRTGKTSVFYQMSRNLDPKYLCILIDLHGLAIDGLGGFLWELAYSITSVLCRDYQYDNATLPKIERSSFLVNPRISFENEFLSPILNLIGECHILLMVDEAIRLEEEVKAGKLEKNIFEYLRHLMQLHERLNFIFSLGSGLEEMAKEYAFLFSVSLYKKITFLEKDAAIDLITLPVKDYYQITPEAIERILQITSGHPYYIQLLCHCLFNRQQKQQKPQLEIKDIDYVLDEAVERGSANLKHVWDDSTTIEKAVLVAISVSTSETCHQMHKKDIINTWEQNGYEIPKDEVNSAIKNLTSRDVITGQDKLSFTVDLQRLWIQKYKRLEWVKSEIVESIKTIPNKPVLQNTFIVLMIGVLFISSVSVLLYSLPIWGVSHPTITIVISDTPKIARTVPASQITVINTLPSPISTHFSSVMPTDIESPIPQVTEQIIESTTVNSSLEQTAQAVNKTQTAIAQWSDRPIIAHINDSDGCTQPINVRSSTDKDSKDNIVGGVSAGELIVITGWTRDIYIWYQIESPNKPQLNGNWIISSYPGEGKLCQSVIFRDVTDLPSELYIENP